MIGIPWYGALILVFGIFALFGGVAFALLSGLGMPSRQIEGKPLVAGADRPAADRGGILMARIVIGGVLGMTWMFMTSVVYRVLDSLYRGKIAFNPADPYPLVRWSFIISILLLVMSMVMVRLVVWMRSRARRSDDDSERISL